MNSNIKNKAIAITGASSGIGEAIARHLAARGAQVAPGAPRQGRLDKIVGEITAAGGRAFALSVDVTKRKQVEAFAEATVKNYGRLDVFINNAGLMPLSPLEANKVDEWEQMVDVNIKGVLYGIAAALPRFQTQKSGHLINISSVAGHVVFPGGAVYCGPNSPCGPSRGVSAGVRIADSQYHHSPRRGEERTKRSYHRCWHSGDDQTLKRAQSKPMRLQEPSPSIEQPADVDVNEIVVRPTVQTL
jgi:NADP-dependent 3-hydroxy acid dehydrogenase YdfG